MYYFNDVLIQQLVHHKKWLNCSCIFYKTTILKASCVGNNYFLVLIMQWANIKSIKVLNKCYKVKSLNLKLALVCSTKHMFVNRYLCNCSLRIFLSLTLSPLTLYVVSYFCCDMKNTSMVDNQLPAVHSFFLIFLAFRVLHFSPWFCSFSDL